MAIIYDIFKRFAPYSTDEVERSNESAYFKKVDEVFDSVKGFVKEEREFDSKFDPLSSILIMPRNLRTSMTVVSFRPDDTKEDLISMLEMALQKVKEMEY